MGQVALYSSRVGNPPLYKHDCDKCRFAGTLRKHLGSTMSEPVAFEDVYFSEDGDVVIRQSDREEDYRALPALEAYSVAKASLLWKSAVTLVEILTQVESDRHPMYKIAPHQLKILV